MQEKVSKRINRLVEKDPFRKAIKHFDFEAVKVLLTFTGEFRRKPEETFTSIQNVWWGNALHYAIRPKISPNMRFLETPEKIKKWLIY